jgi:hypothetical protein
VLAAGCKADIRDPSTWAFIAVYVPEAVVPLGIHVNPQHVTLIAPVRFIHCFALRNTDCCATSIYQPL